MRNNVNARRVALLGLAGLLAFGLGPAAAGTAPQMPPNDTAPAPLWLEASATQVVEGESFEIDGHLGFAVPYELTVELKFGGDVGGKDVAPAPATLVFAKGELFASATLTATEDGEIEAVETLVLAVDDPRVVLRQKQAVEIADSGTVLTTTGSTVPSRFPCGENPKLSIATDTKFVAEGGGAATVTLTLAEAGCTDLSYPIVVAGDADASEILVSAGSFELPMGVTSASIVVSAVDDASDEPLEAIELRLAPTPESDLEVGVTLNLLDNDADIALANLSGPPRLVAGERVQFQIAVINPGHKELTSVRLVETPMAGLVDVEWFCFGKSGAECPEKGVGFVDLSASMPAFSAIVVLVDGLVSPAQRDALNHQASVTIDDGTLSDPNPGDNSAFATHAVEVVADLALELAVGPWDPSAAEPTLTYTATVRNLGPSDASGAELASPLAAHLAWSDGDPDCLATPESVSCTVGALAAGQSIGLDLVLSVLEPYPSYTLQEAWLSPSDPDPSPKNDEAFLDTKLDIVAPTIEEIVALGDRSNTPLGACSQLVETPVRLNVRFDEPMVAAEGDVRDGFRLYRPGADGDFELESCGDGGFALPVTDDIEVQILGVQWNEEATAVELSLRQDRAIDVPGPYRLLVCGSLSDRGDNPLDGDGDGTGGDDAIVGYRVDAGNLVRNGHFDCGLDGWTAVAPSPEDWTLGEDASGSSISRSARIDNSAAWPSVGAGQCVETGGASQMSLELRHRLSPVVPDKGEEIVSGGLVEASVDVACSFYAATSCTEALAGATGMASQSGRTAPTGSSWSTYGVKLQVPWGAQSVLCTVAATGELLPFVLEIDQVRMLAVEWSPTAGPVDEIGGASLD